MQGNMSEAVAEKPAAPGSEGAGAGMSSGVMAIPLPRVFGRLLLLTVHVELESGERVGVVTATYELPQGLTLDVDRGGRSVLVPYDRVVTGLDRASRTIRIDPPLGLLDD